MTDIQIQATSIELVHPKDLKPHPKNPNKHTQEQIKRLCDIIKYQGFRRPITVSNRSGLITVGHGRLMAAMKLELEQVPVTFQDYDSEEQEYADLVADNAIDDWAELDLAMINTDIGELGPNFDINLLGIEGFVLEPADKYGDKDPDEVPEVRKTDIKLGDAFMLGNHKILCGDSTNKESVDRLMSHYLCDCGERNEL